jgi:hypothetical protein
MVIDEEDEEEDNAHLDVAGTAYKESMTSVDGFTRGTNGKVKFNKDTKKRRREEAEDVEMEDVEAGPRKKDKKKAPEPRVGQEFRAKVCFPSSKLFIDDPNVLLLSRRKLAETSKRVVSTHTPTSLSEKQRREGRRVESVSLANDRLHLFISCEIHSAYVQYHLLPIQALVMGGSKQTCFPGRRCLELAVGYCQL